MQTSNLRPTEHSYEAEKNTEPLGTPSKAFSNLAKNGGTLSRGIFVKPKIERRVPE